MKGSKILIDYQSNLTTVSLIDKAGVLKECYVEYHESNRITGNIYKGKVKNVLAGLQSAFVDIGLNRNGFLYVSEMLEDRSILKKSEAIPDTLKVKQGDNIMVQVSKEATNCKGPRLTANITLPGRYVVYMPTISFVGVSNKISDPDMREKLTELLKRYKGENDGFIARTVCRESKKSEIIAEIKILKQRFEQILEQYNIAPDCVLIHHEGDLLFRTVRDMLNSEVESIICNDHYVLKSLKRFIKQFEPKNKYNLEYYDGAVDMGIKYGTLNEIDKLLEHKVMLPSGGHLIIDHTEALTAIDVNTGKFTGSNNHEETVYKTNLEAAVEIARQLRLRNIGGIIVVDFIDMTDEKHRQAVVEALRHETTFDRTKTRVMDMTGLGLVEITRKKTGMQLSQTLLDTCPYCKGYALTHSADYLARKIKAGLIELFIQNELKGAVITVNESIADKILNSNYLFDYFHGTHNDKVIYLIPDPLIRPDTFTITGQTEALISISDNAKLLY